MLNLLPPYRKKDLRNEFVWRKLTVFFWLFFTVTVIFICLLTTTWSYITIQQKAINQLVLIAENSDSGQKIKNLEQEIQQTNDNLTYLNQLNLYTMETSAVVNQICQLIPDGVKINSLAINRDNQECFVGGHADSRQQLLNFQNTLENTKIFYSVELPLSNLLKEQNLIFELSFNLRTNDAPK